MTLTMTLIWVLAVLLSFQLGVIIGFWFRSQFELLRIKVRESEPAKQTDEKRKLVINSIIPSTAVLNKDRNR